MIIEYYMVLPRFLTLKLVRNILKVFMENIKKNEKQKQNFDKIYTNFFDDISHLECKNCKNKKGLKS